MGFSRRELFAAVGTGLASLPLLPAVAAPAPKGITAHTVAEAEKILGVSYTPAQRKLIVSELAPHLKEVKALHQHRPPVELAPATVFRPGPLPAGEIHPIDAPLPAPPKPGPDDDIAFAPVHQLHQWLRRGALTSERLTQIYLRRLETLGPKLECVVTLMAEQALAQARAADKEIAAGKIRGVLHGIPWGAKDLLDTRGVPTTWGVQMHRDRRPERDATVVDRLHRAGAVLLAKLSLGELAMGDIWFGGTTRNPWNLAEGSSGSSAGSAAAVAAGLCAFAIGSETLGSIVSPSMRCGVTGLRPTFGRVPRGGAMPLSWSYDKLGPMGRSVLDTLLVLDAIHGADAADPWSVSAPLAFDRKRPLKGIRCGHDPAWFEGDRANAVDRATLEAARSLGLELVPVKLPELPYDALVTQVVVDGASVFEDLTLGGRAGELRQQGLNTWPHIFRKARLVSAVDLVHVDRLRREVMAVMAKVFDQVDILLSPSFGNPLLVATNATGHPSLTLRAGFTEETLRGFGAEDQQKGGKKTRVPHGVTLWGRLFDDGTLCHVGMALEEKLAVHAERPPL